MSYRDDRYWDDPQYDEDFGEYNNSEDDLAFDFFSNQQDLIKSRGWDFNEMVSAWDAYKASNRFYVFDEFLDSWDKGKSEPPSGLDVLKLFISKLTVDPIGAGLISKGIEGFTREFLIDMFKGDYTNAQAKINDMDSLVANLGMYLAAHSYPYPNYLKTHQTHKNG